MRRVTVEERRARLARRHRLAVELRTDDVVELTRSLVVLHATDPATVYRSAAARMVDPAVAPLERALYDERTLVRMLGMRRTMFIVPDETVPVIQAACTNTIAERERRRLVKLAAQAGVCDDCEAWVGATLEAAHQALLARGAAFGAELSAEVPALREKFSYGEGKKYASTSNFSTFVLNLMSMQGLIVRGRPRGTWNGSQYRWAPVEDWLPGGIPELPRDGAQVALIREWLRTFGPGSEADIKWWTGLTFGDVRRALAVIQPVEIDMDGRTGLLLPDDVDSEPVPEPWVALLPPLDPTPMGWTERDWYLGDHKAPLFDRSGNIGPTVWCDGRIIGGWAQRKGGDDDGAIVYRLFEDVGSDVVAAIDKEADRLTTWHGDVRPTPRFRTPLERELSA